MQKNHKEERQKLSSDLNRKFQLKCRHSQTGKHTTVFKKVSLAEVEGKYRIFTTVRIRGTK